VSKQAIWPTLVAIKKRADRARLRALCRGEVGQGRECRVDPLVQQDGLSEFPATLTTRCPQHRSPEIRRGTRQATERDRAQSISEILGRDDRIVVVEDAELQTAGTDIDREMFTGPACQIGPRRSDERSATLQGTASKGNLTP